MTNPAMRRRSQAERVAEWLGCDIADVRDAEYQPGNAVKVFCPSHAYYCSPNRGQKLPVGYNWQEVGSRYGLPVFKADPE